MASYYLVRTEGDDDRPEHTADEIARVVAVSFHEDVAAMPWYPGKWLGESQRPGDEGQRWCLRNRLGNPPEPEETEVVVDGGDSCV
jgi:hypothetical protein